ncbi:MAG: ABC transporter substrate-binding protein [Pyrinomonadaceae bacterium]
MKKLLTLTSLLLLFFSTNLFAQEKPVTEKEDETIRVGVFIDLSGFTSIFGKATKNGIELAVEEINRSGGINGRKIELFIEDDEGRPEYAKKAVEKLISRHKVHAVLGEVASTNSLAAAPVAQEAKIPMISPSSTNPRVTAAGNYIFRTCFVDPLQGEAMANFALFELGATRIAIMNDVQSDYSKGLASSFEEMFIKYRGKVINKQSYTQNDVDFKSQLTEIKRNKPDAIYVPGYYGEVGVIVKQARELGIKVPILGGNGWDSPKLWELGGKSLENTYITNHFASDDPSYAIRNFSGIYREKFEMEADSLAALGYDSAYVLADALRRAGSTDGETLRKAIAQTNYNGITGRISFDESRNPRKPVIIQKLDPKAKSFKYFSTVNP